MNAPREILYYLIDTVEKVFISFVPNTKVIMIKFSFTLQIIDYPITFSFKVVLTIFSKTFYFLSKW